MKFNELLDTNPFEFSEQNKDLFIKSMRDICIHHYKNNSYFKYLWDREGISPFELKSEADLEFIPFILVNIFKHHKLISGPEEKIILSLGSSGTTGQRSMIYLDQDSLNRVKKLAFKIHEGLGITNSRKYNYLCFTYDPNQANDLGTAFTDELLTSFTEKNEVYYTFKDNGNGFEFDEIETLKKLEEFQSNGYSTRILGFPAFLYQLIKKYKINFNLGEDSWVQTGGGWKNHSDQEIPKQEFRKMVSNALGIPITNIRDLFGMVEHGIPYVDDELGRLRIPNYARVLIRDPKDLSIKKNGEVGLIQFFCSYNTSFPAPSLLTTDYGKVYSSKDGKGDILEVIGRAGARKHKGCAIQAMESFL